MAPVLPPPSGGPPLAWPEGENTCTTRSRPLASDRSPTTCAAVPLFGGGPHAPAPIRAQIPHFVRKPPNQHHEWKPVPAAPNPPPPTACAGHTGGGVIATDGAASPGGDDEDDDTDEETSGGAAFRDGNNYPHRRGDDDGNDDDDEDDDSEDDDHVNPHTGGNGAVRAVPQPDALRTLHSTRVKVSRTSRARCAITGRTIHAGETRFVRRLPALVPAGRAVDLYYSASGMAIMLARQINDPLRRAMQQGIPGKDSLPASGRELVRLATSDNAGVVDPLSLTSRRPPHGPARAAGATLGRPYSGPSRTPVPATAR